MVAEQDLIEHVHSRIARYKAPKLIQFVDELPKTSTGKVQKYALRDLDCARAKVGGSGDGAGLVDNSG